MFPPMIDLPHVVIILDYLRNDPHGYYQNSNLYEATGLSNGMQQLLFYRDVGIGYGVLGRVRYLDRKFYGFTWWRNVSRTMVELEESVRKRGGLEGDAQKMRRRQSQAGNRMIKDEKKIPKHDARAIWRRGFLVASPQVSL